MGYTDGLKRARVEAPMVSRVRDPWTGNGCTMLIDVLRSLLRAALFFDVAETNKRNDFICCLCRDCQNKKYYSASRTLHNHIFTNTVSYPITFVGPATEKRKRIMEDNEEEDCDDNFPGHVGFDAFDDDTAMEEPEGEMTDDDPTDDLGQALCDAP
ncbi:uncharacterized protein LOC112896317 [Panicum hallii]|uniref:uncharacterized protein LOC112896317 n=1 Tax=Panicum hallii TaxID=206008 RepID=UPI000DF4E6F2|nr:uncharacterized protein LOC112896317 [Panicum hallii]